MKQLSTPIQDFHATRPWNFPSFSVASRILPVEPYHSHLQPTALATPPQVSAACSSHAWVLLENHGKPITRLKGNNLLKKMNETLTCWVHPSIFDVKAPYPTSGRSDFSILVFTSGLRPWAQPEKSCAAALDCQGCSGHFIHCCESLNFWTFAEIKHRTLV